jgi:hypothetical protein
MPDFCTKYIRASSTAKQRTAAHWKVMRDVAVCCLQVRIQATSPTGLASHQPQPNYRIFHELGLRTLSGVPPPPTKPSSAPPANPQPSQWRQRLRSTTSPSPTRASTAGRRPARRRSSRMSASPSTPASDASSSAPTAQVSYPFSLYVSLPSFFSQPIWC